MKELTAKDIKEGMTQGDFWKERPIAVNELPYHTISVYSSDGTHIYDKRTHSDHLNRHVINSKAIVTAINSTYGKGLDPEKMEECVKALEEVLGYEERGSAKGEPRIGNGILNIIHKALDGARIK
jgi:hypothetical protein